MRVPLLQALVICLALATASPAEDTWGLSLLDRNTLTGWEVDWWNGDRMGSSDGIPRGWNIVDGRLSGRRTSTPLISGWTFGDFELRFDWKVEDGGAWQVSLPILRSGEDLALELILAEGESAAKLRPVGRGIPDGYRSLTVLPTGSEHVTTIRRKGSELNITVDDRQMSDVEVWDDVQFGLGLSVARGAGSLSDLRVLEPLGKLLDHGGALDGWWTPGNLGSWRGNGDTIACENRDGNYLRTEAMYGDFTLSLDYQMPAGGNSGIGIRTPRDGWPSSDGIELQLLDEPPDAPLTRSSNLALYGNLEPLARGDRPGEWNHLVVKSNRGFLTAWVNGVLVQHADTARLPELQHRPSEGWIGLQDHGAPVVFRDIRVLEMKFLGGHLFGYQGIATNEAWRVLFGLMEPGLNQEREAEAAVRTIQTRVEEDDPQVLCDLQRAGALVRLNWTGDGGRLAFYFDEEDQPRIDCAASELKSHVPPISEDAKPLVTYLPYESHLKIVATGAAGATYLIDCLEFPRSADIESFRDIQSGIPRGMLPAIAYRREQLGWGVHRQPEPAQLAKSKAVTIAPGERTEMIALKGLGTADWLKLHVAPPALANNALWLEVTVDDEKQPAIAAPARFLFPGLQGGQNYQNFAVTYRDGFTSMLPMPYWKGLRIAVVNRGTEPIADVAISVPTVDFETPMDDSELELDPNTKDFRVAPCLRGVFKGGDNPEVGQWPRMSEIGRWIAIVYASPESGDLEIAGLSIDGQDQPGWDDHGADLFFGLEPGETDVRKSLSGRSGGLAWSYLLLSPVPFKKSIDLKPQPGKTLGDRLILYYAY